MNLDCLRQRPGVSDTTFQRMRQTALGLIAKRLEAAMMKVFRSASARLPAVPSRSRRGHEARAVVAVEAP